MLSFASNVFGAMDVAKIREFMVHYDDGNFVVKLLPDKGLAVFAKVHFFPCKFPPHYKKHIFFSIKIDLPPGTIIGDYAGELVNEGDRSSSAYAVDMGVTGLFVDPVTQSGRFNSLCLCHFVNEPKYDSVLLK